MTVERHALPDQFQVRQAGLSPAGRPGQDGGRLRRAAGPAIRCRRSGRWPKSCASTATPSPRPTPSSSASASSRTSPAKGCFVRSGTSPVQQRSAPHAAGRRHRRRGRAGASPSSRRADFLELAEERFDAFQTAARARRRGVLTRWRTLPAIEIRDLVRRYGRTDAVNGLSLRVAPGRCYGFFGRNGAGKTTTIKCLLNLLRPTAGEVRVFGLDPARAEVAVKSRLAYVPDVVAFYPWMTVRAGARLLRVVPRALEPRHGAVPARPVPPRPAAEDQPPVEGAAHAAGADRRDLPGARAAGARRAHLRPRSDRAPRVHPDRHRRVSGRAIRDGGRCSCRRT